MAGRFKPTLVKYARGSCFVVEGKSNTDRFFIIQEGKVRIIREVDAVMKKGVTLAGPGDIIGAVSAMAGYSYIETVIALTNVSLLAVETKQYGELIRSNIPVAMKIIRQFSQRLRTLGEMLSRRALSATSENAPSHLLQVADFYFTQRRYDQAFYAWQQYAAHCPGAENMEEVRRQMMQIASYVKITTPVYPPDKMERTYPEQCLLFAEGESGHELYIIQDGAVKLTKIVQNQEVVLAVLGKGDICGEMALLDEKPRAATAEVYEQCTVLAINRANFKGLIQNRPELVARLTRLMAERIWLMYKQIANTIIENPLGRIYDALLIQLEKDRVALHTNQYHQCNFGFGELAGMAGIPLADREALLKKIMVSKRINLINDKIVVTDASDVLRQTEYYRRVQRISAGRGAAE
jgi:CRP-like cAMP-binding protein